MKKMIYIAIAVVLMLSLAACGQEEKQTEATEPDVAEAPKILSAEYADMLKNGTYYYCLTADTEKYLIDITAAGKDGMYYARMGVDNEYICQMVLDGVGYAVHEQSEQMQEFDPATEVDVIPDFSTLEYKATTEENGRVTDSYTFKMKDGSEKEQLFVFENGKLIEMTTPSIMVFFAK